MLKVLSNILCDLDPKVKVIGQKAGICDGVPSTSALVKILFHPLGGPKVKYLNFAISQFSIFLLKFRMQTEI